MKNTGTKVILFIFCYFLQFNTREVPGPVEAIMSAEYRRRYVLDMM